MHIRSGTRLHHRLVIHGVELHVNKTWGTRNEAYTDDDGDMTDYNSVFVHQRNSKQSFYPSHWKKPSMNWKTAKYPRDNRYPIPT